MMRRDGKGFEVYMKDHVTDDFKYVENGKSQSFDEMCQGITLGLSQMMRITGADSKVVSLRQNGDKATAMVYHSMGGILGGQKTHRMTFTGTSRDDYVRAHGKWLLSRMEWVKQAETMDGKPTTGM